MYIYFECATKAHS